MILTIWEDSWFLLKSMVLDLGSSISLRGIFVITDTMGWDLGELGLGMLNVLH